MFGMLVLAIMWTVLIFFQLLRTIQIDAYELSQSRLDLLGYWFAIFISGILCLKLLNQGRLKLTPIFLVISLMAYISIVMAITAPSQSIKALLVSRYGLATWFTLGIGFTAVIDVFLEAKKAGKIRNTQKILIFLFVIIGLWVTIYSLEMISDPPKTINYQVISSSAAILLLITAGIIFSLSEKTISALAFLPYIAVGNVLVVATALTQSISIIAIWIGIMLVIFSQFFRSSRLASKVVILSILPASIAYAMANYTFLDIIGKTRLSVLFDSTENFTPWTSRASLLNTFPQQFAVSPIFGNFEAEIVSGVGSGWYLHSIPLSFLTHTGLVGTGLFFYIFFLLVRKETDNNNRIALFDSQMRQMMWIIFGVGAISVFFTWPVLWFMMGALCKRFTRFREL